jgi:hypothetical protein
VVGLLLVIEHFLPVFSRRSFERHHGAWYRLFSSARWSADDLGRRLVSLVLETFVAADVPVVVALDDTLAHPNCRSRPAVERTVPWVATLCGITIVWYERLGHRSALHAVLCRPWYRHRKGPSYADIARGARVAAAWSGLVEPLGWRGLDNKWTATRRASAPISIRTAA